MESGGRLAARAGRGVTRVALASCLWTALPSPTCAQEAGTAVDSTLFGEALPGETMGLSLDPFNDAPAALPSEAAEELARESEEELKKIIPEAFLIRLAAGGIYDDNLFLTDTDQVNDIVMQAQLGVTIRHPDPGKTSFSLNYNAVGFMYLDHSDLDAINHAFGLTAGLSLPKTQLGFSASYERVAAGDQAGLRLAENTAAPAEDTNPNPTITDTSSITNQQSQNADQETGSFSVRNVLAGNLSASRSLAPKTNLTASLGYSGTLYEDDNFQNSEDYSARVGLNYEITGKTTLGLAASYGYLNNGQNATQTYQNILVTAAYNASGKLVFRGEAGVEFRQYGKRQAIEPDPVPPAPVPVPVVIPVEEPVVPPAPVVPPIVITPNPPLPGPTASATPEADRVTNPVTNPGTVPPTTPPTTPAPVVPAPVEPVAVVPVTEPTPVNDYTTSPDLQEEDSTRFVFNLQAAYQIRVRTALRLSASRSTEGSAVLGGPSVERTTVSAGVDQGIGRRFAVGLESGYEWSDYGATQSSAPSATSPGSVVYPSQVYWYGRASLNFMPRPNTSIGVFYEFRSNDSGSADAGGTGLTYEASRFGVQAAINF